MLPISSVWFSPDSPMHGVPLRHDGIWFSRRDDGSLFLDAEEARDYPTSRASSPNPSSSYLGSPADVPGPRYGRAPPNEQVARTPR